MRIWRVCVLFLVAAMLLGQLPAAFRRTGAYLALNRAVGPAPAPPPRRHELLARFSDWAGRGEPSGEPGVSPLRALYIATYQQWQRDLPAAASSYVTATGDAAFDAWQRQQPYRWRGSLLPGGDVLLEDFTQVDDWRYSSGEPNPDVWAVSSEQGVGRIDASHLADGDQLAYSLYPNPEGLLMEAHRILALRLRLEEGVRLTVEVRVDNAYLQPGEQLVGPGAWQTIRYALPGEMLRQVTLIVQRQGDSTSASAWLEWIRLELDA